jgi:hypothetical protein
MNAIFAALLSTSATECGGFISYNTAWAFVNDVKEIANDIEKVIKSGASQQLERGLKGVFIVDPPEKLPWSQDLIWLLDDWRLQEDGTIYSRFNTPQDLMHDGRWGNVVTVNGRWKPEVTAAPGERIRLRLINGANARVFLPAYRSHHERSAF